MRLDLFENGREHLSTVLRGFKNSIDTSEDANAQKAQDSKETYKKQLEGYEIDKANAEKQMEYWHQKESEFNVELSKSNIEQVKKAKEERDRIEKALIKEKERLEDAKKTIVNAFNNRPYSFFGMPAIKKSLELLEKVKDSTESIPGMDQDAIDYLLNRGYCICGTKLDPGSIPLQKVMEERRKLPPEHIGAVVMNYKTKSEGYLSGTEDYCKVIQDKYKEMRLIKRQIGILEDELAKQSDLILDDTDAKTIENNRRNAHTHYLEAQADYSTAVANIGSCKRISKIVMTQLKNLLKVVRKTNALLNLLPMQKLCTICYPPLTRRRKILFETNCKNVLMTTSLKCITVSAQ